MILVKSRKIFRVKVWNPENSFVLYYRKEEDEVRAMSRAVAVSVTSEDWQFDEASSTRIDSDDVISRRRHHVVPPLLSHSASASLDQ